MNPDGTLKWSIDEADGPVHSSPAVGADGTIYVGAPRFRSGSPGLMALNPDGTLRWLFPTGAFVGSTPAVGADGTIYVGSDDRNVYAMNPDGSLRWSFATDGPIGRASLALGSDGTVFVKSQDQRFYAINAEGTMKWALETGVNPSDMSSPVVAADGTIYDVLGKLLVAISSDGTLKWTSDSFFPVEGAVSSVALGADGTLYAVFSDGKLYAIGQGNTPLGTDVAADLAGGTAVPGGGSVLFAGVTSGGDTVLTSGDAGPAPPAGFQLGSPPTYYDVTTTATFEGPATVCINYAGASYGDESALALFHLEDEVWVDRTVSLNTVDRIICASVFSLSPFAIVEPTRTPLTALAPARLWAGLANSDSVGLRLDVRTEVFLNNTSAPPVAEGALSNVSSGRSGYGNAVLHTVALALTRGPVMLSRGDELLLRVSVRRTCAGAGHASGTARLWYNGAAVDSGTKRDAASRFGAVMGGADSTHYLRASSVLATAPGSSRLFIDKSVGSSGGCPNRPYVPFGTWSVTPP